MATNTIQEKPKLQKILTLITLTLAALMIVIPAAFIWHSQATLEDGHLTHLGAVVRTWISKETGSKTWIGNFENMYILSQDPDLTMTPAAAEYLAKTSRWEVRIGQYYVSEDIAIALSKFPKYLSFSYLENPTEETLRAVVSGSLKGLSLPLRNPTPEDAGILGQFKGHRLSVFRIGQLSPSAAKAFVQSDVERFTLSGLDQLSRETAEELSKSKCRYFTIGRLQTLSKEAAVGLSKFEGLFLLLEVNHISDEAAVALSQYPNNLLLTHLKDLSETAARTLAAREYVSFSSGELIGNSGKKFENFPDSTAAILKERNKSHVVKFEDRIHRSKRK